MKILQEITWLLIILSCCYPGKANDTIKIEINLNATCTEDQLYTCTISDLSPTLDSPLVVSNGSALHLRELVLRNCIIRLLPVSLFRLTPNLTTFVMHNCGIYRLNTEDFQDAGSLQQLVLQKNRISKLADKQFASLHNLQMLELGYNIIHIVHKEAFFNLTQLRYLGLQGNGIRTLMEGVLEPLLNLEHIDLSGNEIEKIDTKTFQSNHNLKTLLLNGNFFSSFEPNALVHLNHLRLLDLSNCALEELQLQSVETLMVQSSGLKRLIINEGVIQLHAGNNELTHLSIGDKLAVIELDLHNNLIDSLEIVYGMFNLQRLDLSKNKIKTLHIGNQTSYLPLLSLMNLNLASNQLMELSADNVLILPRLIHLDIAFNHLLRLTANVFEPLINLEKLYIEGNRLHEFNYELFLRNHAHLKELGLCDNEWEFHYMHKMITYFSDRGVHLVARYTKQQEIGKAASASTASVFTSKMLYQHNVPPEAQAQEVGGSSIHPYWTTRDVLALITLIVVLVIMLMQLYRILQDDDCFSRCRAWRRSHMPTYATNGARRENSRNRPRRLDEEVSELSSSE